MSPVSIAIIGLNGSLGKPTLEAINSGKFDSKIKFPIKALTRKAQTSTDKIQYIQTEITPDTIDSIVEKLRGTDVIIELVSHNPDLLNTIEPIIVKSQPKLFIPSQFGSDLATMNKYIPGFLGFKNAHSENVRKAGIKSVDIVTNFFAEPSKFLYEVVGHVGIDPANKSILQLGDLNTRVAFTRVEDIGNVIVAVATTAPESLPDKIRVKSGSISYQDAIDRYEQTHNVKLEVKEKYTVEEAKQQLSEKLAKGFNPADFLWYLHVGGATGDLNYDDDNELINPNQFLWKWTEY
ncbi:CIP1 protein [Spathaspora passalidarum NRRL Y-27907]|uniref:CIP1 protein n=1 Tax=Spathaspora passalidarum (strain NRRL Y-27907 / 11-Y1) TaxID=619300 RepID=G3AS98_SPAPN|nr:CIP1 protein [Spathaspora passalidarum NRRL Y-27907]EGW30638.1 CIP1 protein [Spathaspora passalidarum NRRL Y-27907]